MIRLRRVVGGSMLPTLYHGQVVLVSRSRKYRIGDIIVADVGSLEVVKRLILSTDEGYHLAGDNIATEHYVVSKSKVIGKVIWPKFS